MNQWIEFTSHERNELNMFENHIIINCYSRIVGHSHPKLVEAMKKQLTQPQFDIDTSSSEFARPTKALLDSYTSKLLATLPGSKFDAVLFVESGYVKKYLSCDSHMIETDQLPRNIIICRVLVIIKLLIYYLTILICHVIIT